MKLIIWGNFQIEGAHRRCCLNKRFGIMAGDVGAISFLFAVVLRLQLDVGYLALVFIISFLSLI